MGFAALITIGMMSAACNLSSQFGASNEVALNPPTLEASPTRTITLTPNPTRTPFAAPTITVLGSAAATAQPSAQSQAVSGAATVPPPADVCSLKSSTNYDVNVRVGPSTDFKILSVLPAGQYMLVIKKSENGWLQIPWGRESVGWVSPRVVTLYGPCDGLNTTLAAELSSAPTLTPTPTGMFGFTMNIPLNHLVTKVDVGSIPAGTTVVLSTSMFNGTEYIYEIMTADGRYEKARDSQLMVTDSGGALPFPTPTAYVYSATPTAMFQSEVGMLQFRVVTLTQIDDIPAGTAVRIGSATYNGKYWLYDIATRDEKYSKAAEYQLSFNVGSGPTATLIPVFTATPQVMGLPSDVSPSDVVIPNDLCTVTANSVTNLYAAPNSSTVVGVLNPGPWAQVGAKNGQGWYKVTIWIDGSQGWTTTATVTLHGPCDALPVES